MNNISQDSVFVTDSVKSFGNLRSQILFLLFLALIFFINFISRIIFSPLIPTIEDDLNITHTYAGVFFLFMSIGYCIGMLSSSFLSAATTHKKTISLSAIALGVVFLPISFSSNKWVLLIAAILLGLTAGPYFPSGLATITSMINSRQWGKAIAVHDMAPNVAFVVAPLLAEFILLWFSWRTILFFLGMTSILLGMAYARWGKGGNFAGEMLNFSTILKLVKQRSFFIMLIVFCAGIGGFLGVYTMLPLYLVTEQGMEREIANTLIAMSRIPCLAAVFIGGWLTDRFGPKRTLLWVLILNGTLTIALGFGEGVWTVVFVFLQPMISVCFPPAALVTLSLIYPQEIRHIAVSITIPSAFIFGGGILPILIGTMGDAGLFGIGIAMVGGFILMVPILLRYLIFVKH